MSVPKVTLDDDKKFILLKFKREVSEILQPHHDERYLLRWLKARSWDSRAAEKMLRQSMKWRQQWQVDGALKDWTPPEAIQLYFPSGICGLDKEGAPVIVVPFSGFDIVGLLHATSRQDIIKKTIQVLEYNLARARETGANEIVVLFDMDGFTIKPYTWRPAGELVLTLIQMYEANYPEILKACYIINAPKVFAIAFTVVKRFLNEYTIRKIQIFPKDSSKWKAGILQNVAPDNLPKYFGGELVDPDGNPRYATKVKQGGKVPKSFYKKNMQESENDFSKWVSAVIKSGEKLVLDFVVSEEGCFLKWEFKTQDHDIRFGVTLIDESGNTSPVIQHRRIAAHQIDENGIIACQAPATYTVTFDNSYSMLRSKKIKYNVQVIPPITEMSILPTEDDTKDESNS